MATERVNPVRFGTDGWRAIIAEDFTFENVRACAQAIALHFREAYGLDRHVVTPAHLSKEERGLFERFADLRGEGYSRREPIRGELRKPADRG